MYGLRNSELSTCLFQFSHKTRQCCCTLILLPKSTLNATLTTTNRVFTNDDWQCGRFENFESDQQYESNLESDVRFEIESNHEASHVPTFKPFYIDITARRLCRYTWLMLLSVDCWWSSAGSNHWLTSAPAHAMAAQSINVQITCWNWKLRQDL